MSAPALSHAGLRDDRFADVGRLVVRCPDRPGIVAAVLDGADPEGLRFATDDVLDRVEQHGDLFGYDEEHRAPLPDA